VVDYRFRALDPGAPGPESDRYPVPVGWRARRLVRVIRERSAVHARLLPERSRLMSGRPETRSPLSRPMRGGSRTSTRFSRQEAQQVK